MTCALLIIDVQESFRQGPLWPAISNPGIASDVARLVDGARANGDLVVWVLHSEPGSGTTFDPASGHVRYIDPLKPQAGEPQLIKTSHNAFTTTNLQQLLTQQGISEVIVCGIRTEQCCETTARVAFDLGYQVTFVTEAGTGPLADATLKALAAHHAQGGTVASVCAGADALGRAGLLDGRRCTTHHDIQDELAQRYPAATVIRTSSTSSTAGSPPPPGSPAASTWPCT